MMSQIPQSVDAELRALREENAHLKAERLEAFAILGGLPGDTLLKRIEDWRTGFLRRQGEFDRMRAAGLAEYEREYERANKAEKLLAEMVERAAKEATKP